MHQALFAHKSVCSFSMLSILAVRVGLQLDRFLNDLHDVTLKELVMADVVAAGMADVTIAPTLFVGTHRIQGKLTQARLFPLIHHYLRNPTTQVLSTVDQLDGIINWSTTGLHL